MNGKLILASTKSTRRISFQWIGIISAIIFVPMLIHQAPQIEKVIYDSIDRKGEGLGYIITAIICGFYLLLTICSIEHTSLIKKSHVNLYENCITGSTFDQKSFLVASKISFEVKYDQVLNVDTLDKDVIVIHTSYGNYRCIAGNTQQIKMAILQIKEQHNR